MRVKLTLRAIESNAVLPLDYNHAVSSLIYSTLRKGSQQFALTLHDQGFQADGRSFKLFTFSRIQTKQARLAGETLVLEHPEVELQISSPVIPFIEHLLNGFSKQSNLMIAGASFELGSALFVPQPEFRQQMSFHALSPVTETQKNGGEHPAFLSLTDNWSEITRRNLIRKYSSLYGREPQETEFNWQWDEKYIAKAERRGKRLSVLRDVHGIKIRGWLAPFTVTGSVELIRLGYEAGFGARNSMGFGMAEVS
ncbi:MAG TPA: CRISPR-associated endoribonuclease Cas6 [Pyrinomonadaceae bacterium]|nr:CRISPR-associated endoribonuclease Cas6 [Pyrinomonadaceae bacterium]